MATGNTRQQEARALATVSPAEQPVRQGEELQGQGRHGHATLSGITAMWGPIPFNPGCLSCSLPSRLPAQQEKASVLLSHAGSSSVQGARVEEQSAFSSAFPRAAQGSCF